MERKRQPLDDIVWRDRSELKPNNYNPNKVAPPEIELLKVSIIEDGWTQPIVINPDMEIVDGFHRWTVSGHKEIFDITGGKVPTVMTAPVDKHSQQMATIRHNRARGTHAVVNMSKIVSDLVLSGVCMEEIMLRLGMEREEVIRLTIHGGVPKSKIVQSNTYSQSWKPV